MKRITSLVAACVAAIGLCPSLLAQTDVTSQYLVNPDLEEGLDSTAVAPHLIGNRYTFYSPKGWQLNADMVTWDTYSTNDSDYWTGDQFGTPQIFPTSGHGFYHHSLSNGGTYVSVTQGVRLPAGKYKLTFDGALWLRNGAPNPTRFYGEVATENITKQVNVPADSAGPSNAILPSWKEGLAVEFAVVNDNDSVTIGFHSTHNTYGEYQIYADNFKLFYLGEVTEIDLVAELNASEILPLRDILQAKYDELVGLVSMDWEDILFTYLDPMPESITTLTEAVAFKNATVLWTNRLDTLMEARAELQILLDSATAVLEKAYSGAAVYQAIVDAAQTTLNSQPTSGQVLASIDAIIDGMYEYIFSGLSEATYDNPVDISFKIVNAGVDGTRAKDPAAAPGWNIIDSGTTGQPYLYGGDRTNPDGTTNPGTYFNTWDGTPGNSKITSEQTITGLPNGIYRVGAYLAGDGTGVYVYGQSGGIYFATEMANTGAQFVQYYAENIVVMDGTLTIGHSGNAAALWSGNASTCTYYAADNFTLAYCGNDINAVVNVLNTAIENAETLLAAPETEGFILKGDIAQINTYLTQGRAAAAADLIDPAAVATSLGEINSIGGIITASVEAYYIVADKLTEAQEVTEDTKVSAEALAALNTEIALVNAWFESNEAVAEDVAGVIATLDAAINAAKSSTLDNVTPGNPVDATVLIKNPDIAANNGWTFTSTGTAIYPTAEDFTFGDGTTSRALCAWYGGPYEGKTFDIQQQIFYIKPGYYKLTARGFNSEGGSAGATGKLANGNVVLYALGSIHHEQQIPILTQSILSGDTILLDDGTGQPLLDAENNIQYKTEAINDTRLYTLTIDSIYAPYDWLIIGVKSIGDVTAGNTRVDDFTLTKLLSIEQEEYPDAVIEIEEAPFTVYVENGYIKVEGVENYTITSLTGVNIQRGTKLQKGSSYIVKAADGRTVKIAVD